MTRPDDSGIHRDEVRRAESVAGRILIAATYLSVGLLAIGVALLVADGVDPRSGGPAFDPTTVVAGLTSLEPAAFLWLGLIVVIGAPIVRVVVSGVAFVRSGDRAMAWISVAILAVIAVGVMSAIAATF